MGGRGVGKDSQELNILCLIWCSRQSRKTCLHKASGTFRNTSHAALVNRRQCDKEWHGLAWFQLPCGDGSKDLCTTLRPLGFIAQVGLGNNTLHLLVVVVIGPQISV